ncbi:anti-sigma factor [Arthrobacter sp. MYb227]|nr:anti-sigma factor [Arthrobacter sp. MYb227]
MEKHENDLTGSYALNALGDSEREELLRHAEESRAVRQELQAFQETAALLGLSTDPVAPPARVKANIMAAIKNTPQLPAAEKVQDSAQESSDSPRALDFADNSETRQNSEPASGTKKNERMFALAAGVLLIAASALTGVVVNQNSQQQQLSEQLSALSQREAQLTEILSAADSRSKTMTMDDGARVSIAYSAAQGLMAVTTKGLPALPEDKAYELWLISSDGATPVGMVDGPRSDGTLLVSGAMEGVTHFGITVEPATGSPAPTTAPIVLQSL